MSKDKYFWCLHCERAIEISKMVDMWNCPFCEANICDLFAWSKVRRQNSTLPKIPEHGKLYPQP